MGCKVNKFFKKSFKNFVCACISVYAFMCGYGIHVCVVYAHICVGARRECQVPFSIASHFIVLRKSLSLNLELGQQTARHSDGSSCPCPLHC